MSPTERTLVVSSTEKGQAYLRAFLQAEGMEAVTFAQDAAQASVCRAQECFCYCVLNLPLRGEEGELLAREWTRQGMMQALLLLPRADYEARARMLEGEGILCLPKPIQQPVLRATLRHMRATRQRMERLCREKERLEERIEDIRYVDRAKCVLIACLKMTEEQAHKHIEKQAMNRRASRREIAKDILKTYELL